MKPQSFAWNCFRRSWAEELRHKSLDIKRLKVRFFASIISLRDVRERQHHRIPFFISIKIMSRLAPSRHNSNKQPVYGEKRFFFCRIFSLPQETKSTNLSALWIYGKKGEKLLFSYLTGWVCGWCHMGLCDVKSFAGWKFCRWNLIDSMVHQSSCDTQHCDITHKLTPNPPNVTHICLPFIIYCSFIWVCALFKNPRESMSSGGVCWNA